VCDPLWDRQLAQVVAPPREQHFIENVCDRLMETFDGGSEVVDAWPQVRGHELGHALDWKNGSHEAYARVHGVETRV
jgi:hypothetical protein